MGSCLGLSQQASTPVPPLCPPIRSDNGTLRGLGLCLDTKEPQTEVEAQLDTDPYGVRVGGEEGVWEGFLEEEVLELSSEAQMWGLTAWPMVMRNWIHPLKPLGEPWRMSEQESERCNQLNESWRAEGGLFGG